MRIVFFGTPDFAVQSLDAIMHSGHQVAAVVTVPDRQAGRGQKLIASAVKKYALEHRLPLLQPERLRDEAFIDALRAFEADAFVVVAFRMLPQTVWAMPPRGTFNLHASLLPQYRGAAPINWAIINGERQTGVTTFLLNEHIDEGSILLQRSTPIEPDDDAGSLHDRLAAMGREAVVATLDGLANGNLHPKPQEPQDTLKPAPKIFKANCTIDFNQPAQRVADHIRGLSPYPAATMRLADPEGTVTDFKVYQVEIEPACSHTPGTLLCDGKRYIKIAAKHGTINILSLQMSGKKRMTAEEFLRGRNITDWKLA
ncbi:MAG: methionyl-tRNA formyltransferase [Bacteroidales bacterium]|nr:methionyl-tRNA formyltransferase [Bacteroidales bacterium]